MNLKKFSVTVPVILLAILMMTNGCIKRTSTSQSDEAAIKSADQLSDFAKDGSLNGGDLVAVTEPSIPTADVYEDKLANDKALSSNKDINDIFFDFDKYTIRDDSRNRLQNNAAVIKSKKIKKVIIEGYCDERGTNEYNLALGERRAQSTKQYLTALGVSPSNISTISYGEEKLFCYDQNEECWQKNRRAHFVIIQENGS